MARQYEPFVIRVGAPTQAGYPVTAEFQGASWSATIPTDFPLLTEQEIDQALGWLERGFIDREYAREFGGRLFETLFQPAIREGFRAAYERVAPERGLRIVLGLPDELAGIPWELMYDADGGHGFLARSATAPLARHFAGAPLPHELPKSEGPLRILLATAAPHGYAPVSTEEEESDLTEIATGPRQRFGGAVEVALHHLTRTRSPRGLLRRLRQRELIQVEVLAHATRETLQRRLVEASSAGRGYHVVHLVAHGQADRSGSYVLLETVDGDADPVPADELAELIAEPTVNLAVLNACETAAAVDLFQGVAQAVIRRGVPAVVGMQLPVLDRSAVDFAREFYAAWAVGEPVEAALAYARRLMYQSAPGAAADWGIPVLYMGPVDGLQVPMPLPAVNWARRAAALVGLLVFTVIPTFYFYRSLLPSGPAEMNGLFNVVVADFGELDAAGQAQPSPAGRELSRYIFESLRSEFNDLPLQLRQEFRPLVWHDSIGPDEKRATIGVIRGATPEERTEAAADLADRIKADVVIYGNLTPEGDVAGFAPEFYVAPVAQEATELVGRHRLGEPVAVRSPFNPDDRQTLRFLNRELVERARALTHFTIGLMYDLSGETADALEVFRQAEQDIDWSESGGAEVLYYFIGREALFLKRVDQAQTAFETARDANSDYARAYVGLGSVAFQKAQSRLLDGNLDPTPEDLGPVLEDLDRAVDAYQTALDRADPALEPQTGIVARLGIGSAYRLQGEQYLFLDQRALAEERFNQAMDELESILEPLAAREQYRYLAQAYSSLGAAYAQMAWLRQAANDRAGSEALYRKAHAAFEKCIAQAEAAPLDSLLVKRIIEDPQTGCRPARERLPTVAATEEGGP
jgi:tetratricopeptide (TPR) repeat protein